MARRTIDEGRTVKTWTYLTPTEDRFLRAFAETLDVSVSTVLRALVQKAIFDAPAPIAEPPAAPGCTHEARTAGDGMTPCHVCNPPITDPLPPGSDWAGAGYSRAVPMPPWEPQSGH